MAKLVVTEFVSLDGVMEAPGRRRLQVPRMDLRVRSRGGWQRLQAPGDPGDRRAPLGRVTYEGFAGAWPSREGEFADKFNTMPKYVVSSSLEDPEWSNTTVLKGDAAEEAARLKQEIDGIIQVPGSRQLVQALIEQDLVDELHLMVFPVVLGTGRRAFGEFSQKTDWRLKESKPVGPDGVVVLIYERIR